MKPFPENDPRIVEILGQLERLSSGDYSGSVKTFDKGDKGDGIELVIAGLNRLGDTLHIREEAIRKKESRIEGLLDILLKYTVLDFSVTAEVQDEGDHIDALAVGLN